MSTFLEMLRSNPADKGFGSANKRHVCNVGDYVMIGSLKGRFAQGFMHKHRGKRYGFLLVNLIESCLVEDDLWEPLTDPVLNLPVYIQTSEQRICGVPELLHQSIYIIEAPDEPDWQIEEGNQYLLECDWGVDYL